MGRKVKCHLTGEVGTSDQFVKIGSYYYKSRDIYDADQRRKQVYKELIDYICREFLGYGDGQPFPPILPKKIKELSFYSNEVILETFKECSNEIHYWLEHKQFSGEYNMISYMFAIVKSKIADVDKKEKRFEKLNNQTKKNVIESKDLSSIGTKERGKDISQFLDEDEL